jgi:ATP/maltotriose-dependent transcriptional regulator MalT
MTTTTYDPKEIPQFKWTGLAGLLLLPLCWWLFVLYVITPLLLPSITTPEGEVNGYALNLIQLSGYLLEVLLAIYVLQREGQRYTWSATWYRGVLQALAFQAEVEPAQAVAPRGQALTLAEPGGLIRISVDEGPPMARLLYEAATRGIAGRGPVAPYARRPLAAFPTAESEQMARAQIQAPTHELAEPLVEPLSERELEVLQLIAEGLTNSGIASRLYLALNTVKAHTRNIYGKLDAHSRTQAVARARTLGIFSSS